MFELSVDRLECALSDQFDYFKLTFNILYEDFFPLPHCLRSNLQRKLRVVKADSASSRLFSSSQSPLTAYADEFPDIHVDCIC